MCQEIFNDYCLLYAEKLVSSVSMFIFDLRLTMFQSDRTYWANHDAGRMGRGPLLSLLIIDVECPMGFVWTERVLMKQTSLPAVIRLGTAPGLKGLRL